MLTSYDYYEKFLETPRILTPDEELEEWANEHHKYPSNEELAEEYNEIFGDE